MKRRLRTLLLSLGVIVAAIYFYRARSARREASPRTPQVVFSLATSTASARAPRASPPPPAPVALTPATAGRDAAAAQGSFEGRVVARATGEWIGGAELVFAHGGASSSVVTDARGAFRFVPREAGEHALALVRAKGFVPLSPAWGHAPVVLVARAGERVQGLVFSLAAAVELAGVVRDRDLRPIEGAAVRLLDERGEEAELGGLPTHFTSGKDGGFVFRAPEGSVLEASRPGFARASATVDFAAITARRVVLTLAPHEGGGPGGAIAGRVVDESGAAVAGAAVIASPPPIHTARGDRAPIAVTTDAEGRFAIEGLDAPSYSIVARRAPMAPASAREVPTGTKDVVLVLARGGRIRGRVRDRVSGAPVAAFTVLVWQKLGPIERAQLAREAVIDATGAFDVEGIPPGSYAVSVAAHGYAPAADQDAMVPAPPAEAPALSFDLGRGGRVIGDVIDAETKKPLAGARIAVEGAIGPGASPTPIVAETASDARGHFELAGLASGLRSLTVEAAGHDGRIVSGLAVGEGGDVGPVTVELKKTAPGEEPRIELTGIGAVLSAKDDALVIGHVLDGGAKEAGLVEGDAIVAIDGDAVTALGFHDAIQRIRGPEGSTVLLRVRRAGGEIRDVAVVRRRVRG